MDVASSRHSLVFPAASRPNINNLISLLPKILPEKRPPLHHQQLPKNAGKNVQRASPNAFERLAPMVDDYPESKERQRRDYCAEIKRKKEERMARPTGSCRIQSSKVGGFLCHQILHKDLSHSILHSLPQSVRNRLHCWNQGSIELGKAFHRLKFRRASDSDQLL